MMWKKKALTLLLIVTINQVPASAGITNDELNNMPKEKARQIPVTETLSAMEIKEPDFFFVLENCLIDLRYFYREPTGRPSPQLTDAIKAFQTDIGHKPTGSLLMGEFEELARRHTTLVVVPIYTGGFHVFSLGDLVSAEGTWVFQDGSGVDPIQTSKIHCRKDTRLCSMVTARISVPDGGNVFGTDSGSLFLDTEDWAITKWSDYEVQAESDSAKCVSYTLTINIQKKEAHMFRRGKWASYCKGIAETPQILTLVDGFKVAYDFWQARNAKTAKLRSSTFRKFDERIGTGVK